MKEMNILVNSPSCIFLICSLTYTVYSVFIAVCFWGDECLEGWMSEVVNVWGGECLKWWTSGVVNVSGGERLILHWGWWTSGVVNVWDLHWGWWTSGVVNVWVVNVLQSERPGTLLQGWTGKIFFHGSGQDKKFTGRARAGHKRRLSVPAFWTPCHGRHAGHIG